MFLLLNIKCGNQTKIFAIEGTRVNGVNGKIMIQINHGQSSIKEFIKIEGINKRFSEFYNHVWKI